MSMKDPVTELDERFSDAGAEPTPWATTRAVLEQAQLSWVTTVRADGRPHVTPLVAVWLDDVRAFHDRPERAEGGESGRQPTRRHDDRMQPVGRGPGCHGGG